MCVQLPRPDPLNLKLARPVSAESAATCSADDLRSRSSAYHNSCRSRGKLASACGSTSLMAAACRCSAVSPVRLGQSVHPLARPTPASPLGTGAC